MPVDPELFRHHALNFQALQDSRQFHLHMVVMAKNAKGRPCTLLVKLVEDRQGNVRLEPVARMIDPEYREQYDIAGLELPPEKKVA